MTAKGLLPTVPTSSIHRDDPSVFDSHELVNDIYLARWEHAHVFGMGTAGVLSHDDMLRRTTLEAIDGRGPAKKWR